ncbi:agc pdk1 protein kinase [Nannochloropsis oceanica]
MSASLPPASSSEGPPAPSRLLPPPRSDKTAIEWKEEGNQYYREKDYRTAADCYTQALALDPDGPTTAYLYLSNRASCFLQLEKWADAAADAHRSLSLVPADIGFSKGYYRLAKACLEMGKYGAANEAIIKGLAQEPSNRELRLLEGSLNDSRARELASIKTAKDPRKRVAPADLQTLGTLGEGNFSRILHVMHRETGEHFALKVLEKSQVERVKKRHPNVANEISMERRILSRLRHPNVIELYHAFQDYTCLYLLLEYCPGGEVWQRLQADGGGEASVGVPGSFARFYAREVICGLSFLHGRGIIHRDVKPENMVLTAKGRLKLIDFGSAKDTEETDLNGPEFVGTPEYMSPEASRSRETLMEGDLWALGCCLYQFLVGLSPFRAPSPYLVFLRSRRCNPTYPAVIPPLARDLIGRLLRKQPQERLGSFRHSNIDAQGHAAILDHLFFSSLSSSPSSASFVSSSFSSSSSSPAKEAVAGVGTGVKATNGGKEGSSRSLPLAPSPGSETDVDIVLEATPREARLRELAAQCVTQAMSTTPPADDFTECMTTLSGEERAVVFHLLERQGRLGEPRILRLAQLGICSSLPSGSCSSSAGQRAKARLLGRVDWSGKELYGLGKADQSKYMGPFFCVYLGGLSGIGGGLGEQQVGLEGRRRKELEKAVLGINRLRPRLVVVSPALWKEEEDGEEEERVWEILGRISESIPVVVTGSSRGREAGRVEGGGCGFWYGGMRGLVVTGKVVQEGGKEDKKREEDWVVEELEQARYNDSQAVLVFASQPWFSAPEMDGSESGKKEKDSGRRNCNEAISSRLRKWALGKLHGRETALRAVLVPALALLPSWVLDVVAGREEGTTAASESSSDEEESDSDEEDIRKREEEEEVMETESTSKVQQVMVRDVCIIEVYRERLSYSFLTAEELAAHQAVQLAYEVPAGED